MSKLLTFGEAIELTKQGVAVSASSWDFVDRITGTSHPKPVHVNDIWSPENRHMGVLLNGPASDVIVQPYMTKMTREGIVNYIPNNHDIYDTWMLSDDVLRCVHIDNQGDEQGVTLTFKRMDRKEHLAHDLPFWKLYDQDMIGYHHRTLFIAGSSASNMVNATLFNLLSNAVNSRESYVVHDGFVMNSDFFDGGWAGYCSIDQAQYNFVEINEFDFDIYQHIDEFINEDINLPFNIIVDVDSLNDLNLVIGDNALDSIGAQLSVMNEKYPLLNWVSYSLQEEACRSESNTDSE